MCGRARCTLNPNQVAAACGFTGDGGRQTSVRTVDSNRFRPSYNVAPGMHVPVAMVRRISSGQDGEKEVEPLVHCMKWGLVPSFTKKSEKPDHYKMFNARSESVKEKASFRRLLPANRCVVAVEGFYEWKKDGSKKQPYYIHFKDDRPLVFAALYDSWSNSDGEILYTFTILTTRCSTSLEWLHDRMPVILGSKSSVDFWLYNSNQKIESLLIPYEGLDLLFILGLDRSVVTIKKLKKNITCFPCSEWLPDKLAWHPVTTEVGKTSCDGPECIKEIHLKSTANNPISKFFPKKTEGGIKSENKDSKETADTGNVEKEGEPSKSHNEGNNESGDVNKEETHVSYNVNKEGCTFERGVLHTSEKEKHFLGVKREFDDVKKSSDSDSLPTKKEKIAKKEDGQLSLLSYFGKK